jgi:hypothetical protein
MTSVDEARASIERSFPVEVFEPAAGAPWDEAFRRFQVLATTRREP